MSLPALGAEAAFRNPMYEVRAPAVPCAPCHRFMFPPVPLKGGAFRVGTALVWRDEGQSAADWCLSLPRNCVATCVQVQRFFEAKHHERFLIFNLCQVRGVHDLGKGARKRESMGLERKSGVGMKLGRGKGRERMLLKVCQQMGGRGGVR